MKHITQQRLLELFDYKQGLLIWKNDRGKINKAGDVAGQIHPKGYRSICVDSKSYLAHRLIFLMYKGYLPMFIDHKYGKYVGDYLWNLRDCTRVENQRNMKISNINTTGVKGVYWNKQNKKWKVQVRTKIGRYFGCYKDLELAELVANEVRDKYHGEFAKNF